MAVAKLKLDQPVTALKYISTKYQLLLEQLGIVTVGDLLTYFPRDYRDTSEIEQIANISLEDTEYTVVGEVSAVKNIRTRGRRQLQVSSISDATGTANIMWFNQSYLPKALPAGSRVILSGKVKFKGSKPQFVSPRFEKLNDDSEKGTHLGSITPVYPLTRGIGEKWLRNRMRELLHDYQLQIDSPISTMESMDILTALRAAHFPNSVEEKDTAYQRLALEELSSIMLMVEQRKAEQANHLAPAIQPHSDQLNEFIRSLPFELTADQDNTINKVIADLSQPQPMHRLLQGDVGSGKTVVAMAAALNAASSNKQVAVLAPTQVLAEQHYQNFNQHLPDTLDIALVTGNTDTSSNHHQILVGTSALLARRDQLFDNLGLLIVDEQHKFGVKQRNQLQQYMQHRQSIPHRLDMTATPIPRTVALTVFGDLAVSTIQTKPAGRLPIHTRIVPADKRQDSYDWVRKQVTSGRQVYWICTLVEPSEQIDAAAATTTYQQLSESVFPDLNIGLLHGRMKPTEKSQVMSQFAVGDIDILVSTTVIEVGIDVANATVMVMENADRMGLAQLHQLRGRVGRGEHQSWCLVFAGGSTTDHSENRLKFFASHSDGMEIAEFDLETRGPGEVYGTAQSGIPDLKIAKLNDLELIETAQQIGKKLHARGVTNVPLFPRTTAG